METWRARGYVPDSDEEEESQAPAQRDATAPSEEFLDIDSIAEDNHQGDVQGSIQYDTNGIQKKDEADFEIKSCTGVTEGGLLGAKDEGKRLTYLANDRFGPKCQPTYGEDDLDELQEEFYPATPAAQLRVELLQEAPYGRFESRRGSAPPTYGSTPSDVPSSPLTELLCSPPSLAENGSCCSPSHISSPTTTLLPTTQAPPSPPTRTDGQLHGTFDQSTSGVVSRRALRQRNPIQLHPYALESEKYKQILKARGVRPLRIAQVQDETAEPMDEDSQEREFDTRGLSQSSSDGGDPGATASSSPPRASHSQHNQSQAETSATEADEFPDVDSILRHPASGVFTQGFKRRKTAHSFSRRGQRLMKGGNNHNPTKPTIHDPDHGTITDDSNSLYNVPPSPPLSGSLTPAKNSISVNGGFRFPTGVSPAYLQTPLTSSDPIKRSVVNISEDFVSDPEPELEVPDGVESDNESVENASASEAEEDRSLQRVQRKIKGVLPASWLRLDLKTQVKKRHRATRSLEIVSPVKHDIHRGVARPISTSNHRDRGTQKKRMLPLELSDDACSDNGSFEMLASPSAPFRLEKEESVIDSDDFTVYTANIGDATEDNRIDAMLPAKKKRSSGVRSRERNQQTRISYGNAKGLSKRDTSLFRRTYSGETRQSKITDHTTNASEIKHPSPKFRPPKLSILDASLLNNAEQATLPQFVRVAVRAARSRSDNGRHSPSQKYLRLATGPDTEDTLETLRMWKAGTILPSERVPKAQDVIPGQARQPFATRSGNEQPLGRHSLPPGKPIERADALPGYSFERARIKPRPGIKGDRQTSLNHMLQRHAMQPNLLSRPLKKIVRSDRWRKDGNGQGRFSSSLQNMGPYRPALLESLEGTHDHLRPISVFQKHITTPRTSADAHAIPNVLLERYLGGEDSIPLSNAHEDRHSIESGSGSNHGAVSLANRDGKSMPHRTRKRRPFRVNTDAPHFRQSGLTISMDNTPKVVDHQPVNDTSSHDRLVLTGLGPFGTQYTTTFDVVPLPSGSFFHRSTLIGSGDFARSLQTTSNRDMDLLCGYTSLSFDDAIFKWGPWDDTVASQLSTVLERISQRLCAQRGNNMPLSSEADMVDLVISFQRSIIHYFTEKLSFHDSVDRDFFVHKCKELCSRVADDLHDVPTVTESLQTSNGHSPSHKLRIRTASFCLVIVNQLRQIAMHEAVSVSSRSELEPMLVTALRDTLTTGFSEGCTDIQTFIEAGSKISTYEHGIRGDQYMIESFVIAWHVAKESPKLMTLFWATLGNVIVPSIPGCLDVRILDRQWHKLFMLLPVLDFNAVGVLEIDHCREKTGENWPLIKQFMSPVLDAYIANPRGQGPTFNAYCRALYGRCLCLIKDWGWRRCESIIGTLFDFFARNNLAHLRNEESHGSPRFLEHLSNDLPLELEKDDRCFHILLKVIGTGLRQLRTVYPDKKIRDIAWRLMPNHGRYHPKEKAIRKEDLEALRNHHDLLCTLYWASPPGFRPRLSVIRNLVDLETSHREACHISIRAWTNLISFQLSTNEPASSIQPFAEWHSDLLEQTLRQRSLARTEAEAQAMAAESSGARIVPRELVVSTIMKNQRQVESTLMEALVSLRNAVSAARHQQTAMILLTTSLNNIFDLFDAKQPRITNLIIQALEIILLFTKHFGIGGQSTSNLSNEDSQDFGDWSAFEDEDENNGLAKRAATQLHEMIYESLSRLLSNCFGADVAPDDAILSKVLETWTSVAQVFVSHGIKTWADYLSPYGHDAWTSLRETEQTRKYTAHFLALLIGKDSHAYLENKLVFLTSWIASVVERDSLLKFQHELTKALLHADPANPLLANPPFWTDANTAGFDISLSDFQARRLSLISCILSNMRESLDFDSYFNLGNRTVLRQEYNELLRHLMNTMKHNYQELGNASHTRGAYVNFVQQVVQLLQQHTADVCPIDRFFTDSTAFPLPSTDPTYVVGRLKSYGLRLQDPRIPKQLSVFFQTVSERAAMDNQQPYLAEQLHAAMAANSGIRDYTKPCLRSFLIQTIFPPYIKMAFTTSCGWLLIIPIFQALERTFTYILRDIDGTNIACVESVAYTIQVLFGGLQESMELIVEHSELLERSTVMKMLMSCFAMITSILPTLDYLTRLSSNTQPAVQCVRYFTTFAKVASIRLLCSGDTPWPIDHGERTTSTTDQYESIRLFAFNELKATLNKNWVFHDGGYHVVRGNSRRQVHIEVGSLQEETANFLSQTESFCEVADAMPALGGVDMECVASKGRSRWNMDDVFL